jgi:hypothetical protein
MTSDTDLNIINAFTSPQSLAEFPPLPSTTENTLPTIQTIVKHLESVAYKTGENFGYTGFVELIAKFTSSLSTSPVSTQANAGTTSTSAGKDVLSDLTDNRDSALNTHHRHNRPFLSFTTN